MTCRQPYLQLAQQPWKNHHHHNRPLSFSVQCALSKQGLRFLSTVSANAGDPSATVKLIGKFVGSSPKFIALNALSHLLSPDTSQPHLTYLALPLYSKIKETSWFESNPKLAAAMAALLDKQGRRRESETLISETISELGNRERDLALFYCHLVESHSEQNANHGFERSYAYLNQLLHSSSSVYVKRRAFESMVSGLCTMDRPIEAESLIEEMRLVGLKPSVFELRTLIYGYGRLGLLKDMLRIVNQMDNEGFAIDTVSSNMVLSSLGTHNELSEMVLWLRKMKTLSIPFSTRTYNSVLNLCPTIMLMLQNFNDIPVSIKKLKGVLKGDEALVVEELVGSGVLEEVMVWDSMEAKLDLHGLHLGSAYLIMLEWMEELQRRFNNEKYILPAEVTVICGAGKHSNIRGVSPVKGMIKVMMARMRSPMRIDRKNIGCLVAKGRTVKDWLCGYKLIQNVITESPLSRNASTNFENKSMWG